MRTLLFIIFSLAYSNCFSQNLVNIGFNYFERDNLSYLSRINIKDKFFLRDNGAEQIVHSFSNSFGINGSFVVNKKYSFESGIYIDNYKVLLKLSSLSLNPQTNFNNPKIKLRSFKIPLYLNYYIFSNPKYFFSIGFGMNINFDFLNNMDLFPENPIVIYTDNPADTIVSYTVLNHLNNTIFSLYFKYSFQYEFCNNFFLAINVGFDFGLTPLYSGGALFYWHQYNNENIAVFNKGDVISLGMGLNYSFEL